jgi:hypothetical protein
MNLRIMENMAMRPFRAALAISISVLPCMFGQPNSDRPAKPVTVCEVLSDLPKYSGKDVAILGRLDCDIGLIDRTCFLAQDQCERPITTEGYDWPTKLLVGDYWEEGMPKPPSGNPQIDELTLIEKLSLLRKTTKLGLHKEPQFKTEGRTITFSHFADLKDEWGIAYGRIFSTPKLKKDNCDDAVGCGGFHGAPAGLIIGSDGLRSFKDEAYPKSDAAK